MYVYTKTYILVEGYLLVEEILHHLLEVHNSLVLEVVDLGCEGGEHR